MEAKNWKDGQAESAWPRFSQKITLTERSINSKVA
jgi:hypothetical protein